MAWLRCVWLGVWLLTLGPCALAQTPNPPAGMSQAQFDALVDAITQAVAAKAKPAKGEKAAAKPAVEDPAVRDATEDRFDDFIENARATIGGFPELVRELAEVPSRLASSEGGRDLFGFFLILGGAILAAVNADRYIRYVSHKTQARMAESVASRPGVRGIPKLLAILAFDVFGLLAVWLVSYGATALFFSGAGVRSRLGAMALTSVYAWRLYMLLFRVFLRPGLSGARLAKMDDAGADLVYRRISTVVLSIVVMRIMLRLVFGAHGAPDGLAAAQLVVDVVFFMLFVWAAWTSRKPMATWFADLARDQDDSSLGRIIGRNWLYIALPFFLTVTLALIYGAITRQYQIPNAMLLTLNAVIGLIFVDTLAHYFMRRPPAAALDDDIPAPERRPHRMLDVVVRSLRVAVTIGVATIVAQTWIVEVFSLVDADGWQALTRSSLATALTLFLAFVGWELLKVATSMSLPTPLSANGAMTGPAGSSPMMRLATLMPLLRIFFGIAIIVLTTLVVLSQLGVNIAPLLAGASVFGLAISFGSQALVKDIVSGVFYLTDDAFRIGEYIDCGRAKGTVEGFTLRSVRLRHQNGQIHIIPFGQLGQITNFSRDWITVKFNLRFKRDTDIEKLRKTVKKIGDELLQDPELKAEFIAPFRMQGVADILDNALLVRFKFTARPQNPSAIQRAAMKKMILVFPALGIEFANSMVAVQTMGFDGDAAGAAASVIQSRHQTEAAAGSSQ